MREDQPVNLKEALKEDLQICNKQKLVFLNYIAQRHNPERDMSHQTLEQEQLFNVIILF